MGRCGSSSTIRSTRSTSPSTTSSVTSSSATSRPDTAVEIEVKRLDPDLPLPQHQHEHDAGVDLHAREDVLLPSGGGRALVPTGIAIAIPPGYAGFVLPRSGL